MAVLALAFLFILGCASPYASPDDISVYFCPRDDCQQELLDFIDSADSSLYCAFYSISLPRVIEKLNQSDIEVRLVTDDHYLDQVGDLPARSDNTSRYMHNKFCVADQERVLTGSFNPTYWKQHRRNNLVVVDSEALAANYLDEFGELWNGTFGGGDRVRLNPVIINGVKAESYFCPEDYCADHLNQQISRANHSIRFMVFSFTDNDVANQLLISHYDGIDVRGVFENTRQSPYSVFELLKFQGVNVTWDGSESVTHHKVFIIDNHTVVTGSYNPTYSGDQKNDENMLIVHDPNTARQFLQEYHRIAGSG